MAPSSTRARRLLEVGWASLRRAQYSSGTILTTELVSRSLAASSKCRRAQRKAAEIVRDGQSLPKWDVRDTSVGPPLATEQWTSREVSEGTQTANGERFDTHELTAAYPTLLFAHRLASIILEA